MRKILFLVLICALILSGCVSSGNGSGFPSTSTAASTTVPLKNESFTQISSPLINESGALVIRNFTIQNCVGLLGKETTFKGTVLYTECGKNCLGGCQSSGPPYCYYGVEDSSGCLVYVRNKIGAWTAPNRVYYPDEYANQFQYGEEVELTGNVTLYHPQLCYLFDKPLGSPECSYFILGPREFH